jgi:hypothetical protein
MGARKREQPTKGEVIVMGILAFLFLISTASIVLVEGRPATFLFWVAMALDLAGLVLAFGSKGTSLAVPRIRGMNTAARTAANTRDDHGSVMLSASRTLPRTKFRKMTQINP